MAGSGAEAAKGFAAIIVIVVIVVLVVKGGHHSSSGGSSCNESCLAERTTCAEWLRLDPSAQDEMASALATDLDAVDTSESFAAEFAANISTDCEAGPTLKVSEVAAALATLDMAEFN